jgi:hypothetical protein
LLAAPAVAWSWPFSDDQSPSDNADKLTSSDLSSATETEGRRLTLQKSVYHYPLRNGKGGEGKGEPPKTCFPACGDCQKCEHGKCMQDKSKNGTVCKAGNKCIIGAQCWDGKCQGGAHKECGACKTCDAHTGKCWADKRQNGSQCNNGNL